MAASASGSGDRRSNWSSLGHNQSGAGVEEVEEKEGSRFGVEEEARGWLYL